MIPLNRSDSISIAEILASLSFALDLTSGQPFGHSQRSCLIAMKIASVLKMPQDSCNSLYLALLIKDAGCSSNAAKMAEIFGSDDIAAKRMSKVTDWTNLADAARYVCAHSAPDSPLLARAARILHIISHKTECSEKVAEARCFRGAQIALNIGLDENAAACIRHLDEHWDGQGIPRHLKGDQISLLGRIACLSQTLEVFTKTFDVATGYQMLKKRSGSWFDPELVQAARAFEKDHDFWRNVHHNTRESLLRHDFEQTAIAVSEARIDAICVAFAQIVDAKSPFTAEHSFRVSAYAAEIAVNLGLSKESVSLIRRAGLLHDLGKLGVSNMILDKTSPLTEEEWETVRRHPKYTHEILKPIKGFARINQIASAHHERLDGRGYYLGLTGAELDIEMRILAVADVFDALSAARPYREALPLERVFATLKRDDGTALDSSCIRALHSLYDSQGIAPPKSALNTQTFRLGIEKAA